MNRKSSELKRAQQSWALLLLLGGGLGILYGALVMPGSEDALRRMIRISGRISALVFSLAFAASSLLRLFPSQATLWLRTQPASGWASICLVATSSPLGVGRSRDSGIPTPFLIQLSAVALAGGGLAYFFTFALAATSNDRAARWLGPSPLAAIPSGRQLVDLDHPCPDDHCSELWFVWVPLIQRRVTAHAVGFSMHGTSADTRS